jgi:ssDNA-binding Zn-finger/Zn-ribbon topoisomerase 1
MEAAPEKCPKCGGAFERRANMFHWRGRFFHGLVCPACNALWDDPSDSFMAHVKATAKASAGGDGGGAT